jgi:hypothetical protein
MFTIVGDVTMEIVDDRTDSNGRDGSVPSRVYRQLELTVAGFRWISADVGKQRLEGLVENTGRYALYGMNQPKKPGTFHGQA